MAAAGFDEVGEECLGPVDNPPEIDVNHVFDVVVAGFRNFSGENYSSIVEDNVDPPELRCHVVGVGSHGDSVRHVDDVGPNRRTRRQAVVGRVIETGSVDVGHGQQCPLSGQGDRQCATDTRTGAGDYDDPAVEAHFGPPVEIASTEDSTVAVGSRVDTPWSQCLRSVRIQGTGLGQRLVLSACSRIYRSPKLVAYFAMWGLRQMVICVQADRFSRHIGDWEWELQNVRIVARDGESITDSRPRCHSVCYSLSWPHALRIRRTRSSDCRLADSGPSTLNQGENSRSRDAVGTLQLRGHPVGTGERTVIDVPDESATVDVEEFGDLSDGQVGTGRVQSMRCRHIGGYLRRFLIFRRDLTTSSPSMYAADYQTRSTRPL